MSTTTEAPGSSRVRAVVVHQSQTRADERQAEMAEALASMRRELESLRCDHQASRQFIREQNKLTDAKYLLRLRGPESGDAATPGP